MTTARRLHWTYADYVRADRMADVKLEYCDGEIFAMAGGTPAHAALSARLIGTLLSALGRGPCMVFSSDLKVRIDASDLTTYPDASVVCGEQAVSPIDAHAITNPTLLVEVTSDSTEDYDRGHKLSHYKQLPSLSAVLFVSHRRRSIAVVRRAGTGWSESEFLGGERVVLDSPEIAFDVDAVYDGITLESRAS